MLDRGGNTGGIRDSQARDGELACAERSARERRDRVRLARAPADGAGEGQSPLGVGLVGVGSVIGLAGAVPSTGQVQATARQGRGDAFRESPRASNVSAA